MGWLLIICCIGYPFSMLQHEAKIMLQVLLYKEKHKKMIHTTVFSPFMFISLFHQWKFHLLLNFSYFYFLKVSYIFLFFGEIRSFFLLNAVVFLFILFYITFLFPGSLLL